MGKLNLSPRNNLPMHMCLQTQNLNEGVTLMVVTLSKLARARTVSFFFKNLSTIDITVGVIAGPYDQVVGIHFLFLQATLHCCCIVLSMTPLAPQ